MCENPSWLQKWRPIGMALPWKAKKVVLAYRVSRCCRSKIDSTICMLRWVRLASPHNVDFSPRISSKWPGVTIPFLVSDCWKSVRGWSCKIFAQFTDEHGRIFGSLTDSRMVMWYYCAVHGQGICPEWPGSTHNVFFHRTKSYTCCSLIVIGETWFTGGFENGCERIFRVRRYIVREFCLVGGG